MNSYKDVFYCRYTYSYRVCVILDVCLLGIPRLISAEISANPPVMFEGCFVQGFVNSECLLRSGSSLYDFDVFCVAEHS